jgi:hypothetical protein
MCGVALKEMFKMSLAIAITVILTSCSVLSDISGSLIELKVTYDDIGEIYCNSIDINHIAGDEGVINYMDNEILVFAQPSATKEEMAMLAKKYNAEIVGFIEKTGDYQLQLADIHTKDDLQSIVNEIETESKIESACLNYVYEISEDTINYGKQWEKDLKNYTDCKGKSWGIEAIRAPEAWKLLEENSEKLNKNLRIGLIDGGFDFTHEDLGFAERFENYNGDLQDSKKNHGTHVAGIMAASSNNTKGICGIYPYGNGNLYGISSSGISSYSENGTYWESVMIEKIALAELILRNVKVINQSQGFNWYQFKTINIGKSGFTAWWDNFNIGDYSVYKTQSNLIGDFLNRLINDGYDFVLVCAAGNDSEYSTHHLESEYNSWLNLIGKEKYPNVYNRIIVVGSIGENYNISNFSNTGNRVDLFAPGEKIFSTVPNNKYSNSNWNGTSMASPHVAGVAAMVWAADSKLTGEQVKIIVCNSASYESHNVKIVDAKMAVMAALKISENHSEAVSEPNNPNYGSIMSYIVDKNDENIRISGAHITAESLSDGSVYDVYSDNSGHFELILSEGSYNIIINADGYEAYSYQEDIQCTAQQVNYIDWAKLTKSEKTSRKYAEDFYGWTIQDVKDYFGVNQCEEYTLLHGNEGLYVPKIEYVFIKGRAIDAFSDNTIVDGIEVLKNGEIFHGAIIGSSAINAAKNTNGRFNSNMIQVSDVNGNYIYVDSLDKRITCYIDLNESPNSVGDSIDNHMETMVLKSGLVKFKYDADFEKVEQINIDIDPDAFEYGGHHYMVYQGIASTFENAKEHCEKLCGHLAIINNEEENMAIFNYIKNLGVENAYFGYSDAENESTWKWYDGESRYTNWHQNEPNSENSYEDYAMFYYKYTDGTWNDGDFGGNTVNGGTNFICEWDL